MRLKLKTVKLAHEYECLFGIGLLITIEGFFFFFFALHESNGDQT